MTTLGNKEWYYVSNLIDRNLRIREFSLHLQYHGSRPELPAATSVLFTVLTAMCAEKGLQGRSAKVW